MKTAGIVLIASTLLVAAVGCSSESKPKEAAKPAPAATQPLTASDSVEVTITATVKAVNYTTRQVTLRDSDGHEVSFVAGNEVKRLNEVKVGDTVTADYFVSLVGELRPPTPDEAAHPIVAIEGAGRSPQGAAPAAGAARGVRVVTIVQMVDLAKMLVTLRGPMGDQVTIRGRKPENLKKLHVGDTIVVTYTEGMAISLQKAPK